MNAEFGEALHKDLGRDKFMTELYEISGSVSTAEWDLKNLDWMAAPQTEQTELLLAPGKTLIQHEPLGVCAVFGAWNFPFILVFKPLI
jgi:aldehyde dehydrogenase (NAD+)